MSVKVRGRESGKSDDRRFVGTPAEAARFAAEHLPYDESFLREMFSDVEREGNVHYLGYDKNGISWSVFARALERDVLLTAGDDADLFAQRYVRLSDGVRTMAALTGRTTEDITSELERKRVVAFEKDGVTYTLQ